MNISSFVWGYLAIAGIAAIVIYVQSSRNPLRRIAKYSKNYSKSEEIIGGLLAALIWPVGIIGALKRLGAYLRSRREKYRLQLFKQKIEKEVEESAGDLDQEERRALVGYLVEVAETPVEESPAGSFDRFPAEYVANRIDRLWQSHDTEEVEIRGIRPGDAPPGEVLKSASIRFSIAVPLAVPLAARDDWGFHMTNDFRKSVKTLDKSMRGRVLDAITEICRNPMEARGDTVKPLTGALSGCWRYRLGNYRLIYQPIKEVRRIDLITIGGRGSAYVH